MKKKSKLHKVKKTCLNVTTITIGESTIKLWSHRNSSSEDLEITVSGPMANKLTVHTKAERRIDADAD